MSTSATLDYESVGDPDETVQYRALHTGAMIGLLLGVLSVATVIVAAESFQYCILAAFIPAVGILVSTFSLSKIRRDSEQYTGGILAIIGLALSVLFLVVGVGYGAYVYVTEVPDGYTRIEFPLRPDEIQERNGKVVPPEIMALDGKPVFIKGYIRPDSVTVTKGIDRFLLVRDNNQCCFGSLSSVKYWDQIDVRMLDSKTVDLASGIFRIGGVLKIDPQNLARGPQFPVFSLEADYAN
jgi:hypothetical protein